MVRWGQRRPAMLAGGVLAAVCAFLAIGLFNGVSTAGAAGANSTFVALSPARVLDTRVGGTTVDGLGPKGALGAGVSVVVPLAGRAGVPSSGVAAVVLNVTASGATGPTYLTVWPTTSGRPLASNLNPGDVRALANLVTVKLGGDGTVSVFNAANSTDVIADVTGYYLVAGGFVATDPLRLADTRVGEATLDGGGPKGQLGPSRTVRVPIAGRAGIPSNATAVVANLTAVNATDPTFLTVWPSDQERPLASSLNPAGGSPVANLVTTSLGPDGSVSVFNAVGQIDVLLDVAGYFTSGSEFHPLAPARLLDSRPGGLIVDASSGGARYVGFGLLAPEQEVALRVAGRAGIPASGAGAVVLNVTATDAYGSTFLTVWPTGTPRPWASSLNPLDSHPVANQVVAKIGLNGSVSLFNAASYTHLIVDVVGWLPGDPNEVPIGGVLAGGGEAYLPALQAGETVRYQVVAVVGQSFSAAASPTPYDAMGLRCDARLIVRRPDLSIAGSSWVDCAGTSPDRSLDVDVTADRSGIWSIDFRSEVARGLPSGQLDVSFLLDGGVVSVGNRVAVPTLAAGQNVVYRFSATPGSALTVNLWPASGGFLDLCDLELSLYRPSGAKVAGVQAQPSDCLSPTGVANMISVNVAAAEAGTYRLVLDNGAPTSRAGVSFVLAQPVEVGPVSLPVALDRVIPRGTSVRWSFPLHAGDLFSFNLHVPLNGSCVSYALRKPDGTVADSQQKCGLSFVSLDVDSHIVVADTGQWTLTIADTGNYDLNVTGWMVLDLTGAAISRSGVSDPMPTLYPGQRYLRPMNVNVGDEVTMVSTFPNATCTPSVVWLRPDGTESERFASCVGGARNTVPIDEAGTWWFGVDFAVQPGYGSPAANGTLTVTLPRQGGTAAVGNAISIPTLRPGETIRYNISLVAGRAYTGTIDLPQNSYYYAGIASSDRFHGGPLSLAIAYGPTHTVEINSGSLGSPTGTFTVFPAVDVGVLAPDTLSFTPAIPENRVVSWSVPLTAGQMISFPRVFDTPLTLVTPDGATTWQAVGLFEVPVSGMWTVVTPALISAEPAGWRHLLYSILSDRPYSPTVNLGILGPGQTVRIVVPGLFTGGVSTRSESDQSDLTFHGSVGLLGQRFDVPTEVTYIVRNNSELPTGPVTVTFTPIP